MESNEPGSRAFLASGVRLQAGLIVTDRTAGHV
jgi:hypothetical protein